MRKLFLLLSLGFFSLTGVKAQTSAPDWNKLKTSGFFETHAKEGSNLPLVENRFWWGLNVGSSGNNANNTYYNGQLVFRNATFTPEVYVRSTNYIGLGAWAKLIHNEGDQVINGNLFLSVPDKDYIMLDVYPTTPFGTYGKKLFLGSQYDNTDPLWLARYNVAADITELRVNVGDEGNDSFIIGHDSSNGSGYKKAFSVCASGEVRIGGNDLPKSSLAVAGTISARQVKIETTAGADFVFQSDYDLKPLTEVEAFVKENKHLPEIPSEAEMVQNGLDVTEMQIKLLQKIEELTLYTIQQQKQLDAQNDLIKELQTQIKQK